MDECVGGGVGCNPPHVRFRFGGLTGTVIFVDTLALVALRDSLEASGVSAGEGLRMREVEGMFTLLVDRPTKDDQVIRCGDVVILMMDPGVQEKLGDTVVYVEEGVDGPYLAMAKPGGVAARWPAALAGPTGGGLPLGDSGEMPDGP